MCLEVNMLSTEQAAKMLGISYQTCFKLIKQGKIKAVKIGSYYKILEEEVERIKKEGTG